MFQFDISGLKERWYDHATRRIISVSPLEVSKNHPNDKRDRTRVWRFVLVDDFSRRCFIRYVGVDKPNSTHVVDFLLQGYAEMGVPLKLYTDNDKIIKFGRNARTTDILNKVLLADGGYENIFHIPGNSRATGKVERLHQTIEGCEKVIGLYLAQRGSLTLEALNEQLAPGIQGRINNEVHSETGLAPLERWESRLSVIRRLDYESLRSAFMADEFVVKLRGDLSVRIKGKSYQLPTGEMYPFANWAGQKLRIVMPDGHDFFTVVGLDGIEYDVVKQPAAADTAGEFRSTRETDANRLRKDLRREARNADTLVRSSQDRGLIPFFDDDSAVRSPHSAMENVSRFPKPEISVDPARVEAEAPGRVESHNPAVHYWEAVSKYSASFASKAECKQFFDSIFPSRDEESWLLESDIEAALENRHSAGTVRRLKAV